LQGLSSSSYHKGSSGLEITTASKQGVESVRGAHNSQQLVDRRFLGISGFFVVWGFFGLKGDASTLQV
jgi:hypothetical protein